MSTHHINHCAVGSDDNYQQLWRTLQELQKCYYAIDLRFKGLLAAIKKHLTVETSEMYLKMLDPFLALWNDNAIPNWLPDGVNYGPKTLERFWRTMRTAYTVFEVRREYRRRETVVYLTMAGRLLSILEDIPRTVWGVFKNIEKLELDIPKAQRLWEQIKSLMDVDFRRPRTRKWYLSAESSIPPAVERN